MVQGVLLGVISLFRVGCLSHLDCSTVGMHLCLTLRQWGVDAYELD